MNKLIIVAICLFAAVACVLANEYGGGYYPQYEERKYLQIPALKLKLGTDSLLFRLPNLGSLFRTEREYHHPEY